jgi:FAD:protein FMN transferase
MGMPISLAWTGRHTATAEGHEAWLKVINQLREVDQTFSTYRDDSIITRLDRGELLIDECPPEVAEVLKLGRQAERQSDGAFSIRAGEALRTTSDDEGLSVRAAADWGGMPTRWGRSLGCAAVHRTRRRRRLSA